MQETELKNLSREVGLCFLILISTVNMKGNASDSTASSVMAAPDREAPKFGLNNI